MKLLSFILSAANGCCRYATAKTRRTAFKEARQYARDNRCDVKLLDEKLHIVNTIRVVDALKEHP